MLDLARGRVQLVQRAAAASVGVVGDPDRAAAHDWGAVAVGRTPPQHLDHLLLRAYLDGGHAAVVPAWLVHRGSADRRRAKGVADALLGELAADPAGFRGAQQVADAALAHDEYRVAGGQHRLGGAEVEVARV